jgi:hypothetical protein
MRRRVTSTLLLTMQRRNTNQPGEEGAKIPIELNTIDRPSKFIPVSLMVTKMRENKVSQDN